MAGQRCLPTVATSEGMGIMPKAPKRPRDFSQAAKLVIDVATGQVEDRAPTPEEQGKDPSAAAMGRKGGAARAAKLSKEARSTAAKKAAKARWKETSGA